MTNNLYLTGFMCSGKTTVGKSLSKILGTDFVDMDELVEKELGMSVAQAFQTLGEPEFRSAETAVLSRLSKRKRLVVAAGGGVPIAGTNRTLMRKSGSIVFLDASFETCAARIDMLHQSSRPLWRDKRTALDLFGSRLEYYSDCDLRVRVDNRSANSISREICSGMFPDEVSRINCGGLGTDVILTWNAPKALKPFVAKRKTAVLTDRNVERLHLDEYLQELDNASIISMLPGEKSKSIFGADSVYKRLLGAKFERGDFLVAIGGGVVTDLGAFVAATYKRGMDFTLVATSFLAAVDAAIGGKAAIDVGGVKNSVGLFTSPKAVIIDLAALWTLRGSRIADGLIEAYKTGLVASPNLAGFIEGELKALLSKNMVKIAQVAYASAQTKSKIVQSDFREKGLRKILNFGHTYGHALESANNYRISHGSAVAAGMKVATHLSFMRGFIEQARCSKNKPNSQ